MLLCRQKLHIYLSTQISRRFRAGISIVTATALAAEEQRRRPTNVMIRKLKSGRKNLGISSTRDAAEQHERDVRYFKRQ